MSTWFHRLVSRMSYHVTGRKFERRDPGTGILMKCRVVPFGELFRNFGDLVDRSDVLERATVLVNGRPALERVHALARAAKNLANAMGWDVCAPGGRETQPVSEVAGGEVRMETFDEDGDHHPTEDL